MLVDVCAYIDMCPSSTYLWHFMHRCCLENAKVQLFPQNGNAVRYGRGPAGLLHITGSTIGRPAWNHLLERGVREMYQYWARMSPNR